MREIKNNERIPLGMSKIKYHDAPESYVSFFFSLPIWAYYGRRYDIPSDCFFTRWWYLRINIVIDIYGPHGLGVRFHYGYVGM